MIIVTVEVAFKDDHIHGKTDAIAAMDTATAAEDGCQTYVTSFGATEPNTMRIYEMWDTMEALQAHFKTPHMATFQQALGGLDAGRMDTKVYDVAGELPFPH